jgi:hypothetical protein
MFHKIIWRSDELIKKTLHFIIKLKSYAIDDKFKFTYLVIVAILNRGQDYPIYFWKEINPGPSGPSLV